MLTTDVDEFSLRPFMTEKVRDFTTGRGSTDAEAKADVRDRMWTKAVLLDIGTYLKNEGRGLDGAFTDDDLAAICEQGTWRPEAFDNAISLLTESDLIRATSRGYVLALDYSER
jgi:hypothetical protein